MYVVLVALNDITCTLEADHLEEELEAATTSVNSQSLKIRCPPGEILRLE